MDCLRSNTPSPTGIAPCPAVRSKSTLQGPWELSVPAGPMSHKSNSITTKKQSAVPELHSEAGSGTFQSLSPGTGKQLLLPTRSGASRPRPTSPSPGAHAESPSHDSHLSAGRGGNSDAPFKAKQRSEAGSRANGTAFSLPMPNPAESIMAQQDDRGTSRAAARAPHVTTCFDSGQEHGTQITPTQTNRYANGAANLQTLDRDSGDPRLNPAPQDSAQGSVVMCVRACVRACVRTCVRMLLHELQKQDY